MHLSKLQISISVLVVGVRRGSKNWIEICRTNFHKCDSDAQRNVSPHIDMMTQENIWLSVVSPSLDVHLNVELKKFSVIWLITKCIWKNNVPWLSFYASNVTLLILDRKQMFITAHQLCCLKLKTYNWSPIKR